MANFWIPLIIELMRSKKEKQKKMKAILKSKIDEKAR